MKNIFFYLILGLIIFSCTENNDKSQKDKMSHDVVTSVIEFKNNDSKIVLFDNERAILSKIVDGKYDSIGSKITWKPVKIAKMQLSDDGLCHTKIDDLIYFHKDENKYALLVLKTNEYIDGVVNSCAGCAPTVGVALFQKKASNWLLLGSKINVCKLGQGGEVPEKRIIQIGENDFALSLSGSELAGGGQLGTEYEHLYFIDMKKMGELIFEYKTAVLLNEETNLVQEAQIEFLKSEGERFYDIKLITSHYDYSREPKKLIKKLPEKIHNIK